MNPLRQIWEFPAHHLAFAWWTAAVLTLWNVIYRLIGGITSRLFGWGRRYKESEIRARIRNLEFLQGNTNALVRYLAMDATNVAIELSWILLVGSLCFAQIISKNVSAVIYFFGINAAAVVLGRALRIRTMLNDLIDYEPSLAKLKALIQEFDVKK